MLSLSIDRGRRGRGLVWSPNGFCVTTECWLWMDGWRDRESKEGRMGGLRRGAGN